MNFLWQAIKKDLLRRSREPWVFLIWIGIPLLVGGSMTLLTGGGGSTPTAELWIADQDQSFVSGLVASYFDQGQLSELIKTESVSLEEGQQRIDDGNGSALLIIPQGFENAFFFQEKSELVLVTNPSQQILPGIIEESLSILVDGAFYIQQVFGDELQTILSDINDLSPPQSSDVAELSVEINDKIQRLTSVLFPPLISLETTVEASEERSLNFALLFFPGVLLMALLFTSQGLSDDLWRERELGTLRRMASSPQSLTTFLAAKLFHGSIIILAVSVFLVLLGFAYHQLPLAKVPLVLLLMTTAGMVFMLMFGLLSLFCPTRRVATLINTILIFPLMMLGGSFFPFEAMPSWMVMVGRWTPNGLVLRQLRDYLFDQADFISMLFAFAVLIGTGLLLFMLSTYRNRQVFSRS